MIVCINLFFILALAINACSNERQQAIAITWNNGKATAIRVNADSLPGFTETTGGFLTVQRAAASIATDILGMIAVKEGNVVFIPTIPFSHGLAYDVYWHGKRMGSFEVPVADQKDLPEVVASFPATDTVPENMLKIYIQFSHPMREGQSAAYVHLVKNNTDTLHNVFLDLQPELWNEDRTTLSMWMDPGRIKRDLQPNLRLGNPLQKGSHYQLVVAGQWQDAQGRMLKQQYNWPFYVGNRDELSPNPQQWQLQLPVPGTLQPLHISFGEKLDHFLLMECLHMSDAAGREFTGKFTITSDSAAYFTPSKQWSAGKYTLLVDGKLEDLAGNNLNRPFDRDMTKTRERKQKDTYTRDFEVSTVH